MRITVPITGELMADGGGNLDKPIRPLDFTKLLPVELTDFAWQAIKYDFESGLVELEIAFKKKRIPSEWDRNGTPTAFRQEEDDEFKKRQEDSENALRDLGNKPIGELYQMAGETRLKKLEKK